jgi:hypothetical protein
MTPLESRKQLLLAESELNRAQLIQEWEAMADEVHALARRIGTFGSVAAAVTSLIVGLTAGRSQAAAPATEKTTWWQAVLKGAGLAGSLWSEFLSPRPQNKSKSGEAGR